MDLARDACFDWIANSMPRLLYACLHMPHPLAGHGGATACHGYLSALVRRFEVDLITVCPPGREEWIRELEELARTVIPVPWTPSPPARLMQWAASAARTGVFRPVLNRPFVAAVHRRMAEQRYDFVQADWTEIAQWIYPAAGARMYACAIDVREKIAERRFRAASGAAARMAAWARWRRIRSSEIRLFRRLDGALALSRSDAQRIEELAPQARAFPMVYYRAPRGETAPPWSERVPGRLLFVGAFDRPENIRAARLAIERILPLVRLEHPETTLRLVGAGMEPGFRAWAEARGADAAGFVENIAEEYRRAALLLAPMDAGGGIHVKCIEAMARALPVLATPVANDGLAAEPGRSILIGDTPEAMAREAVRALGDPAWATRIGLAGQEHARREFGEERALACIERAFGLA